jgi:outer membrane lipopolysaccharide assembly protein LptE/RlpB
MRKAFGGLAVVLVALSASGCGYALAGRGNTLPSHIRRIGVPMFENHSNTPDLDRILTEAVRQELSGRGRFTVVADSTGVDAVLTGIVRPVSLTPVAYTAGRQGSRYLITVAASVEFKEPKEPKPRFAQNVRVTDEYEATGTVNEPSSIFSQDQNALTRIVRAFARQLVEQLLEDF